METREERLAANEARFREVNRGLPPIPDEEYPQFFCECSIESCHEFINLSEGEYAAAHADPMQFVVKPGHELEDIETVVQRSERFNVVCKPETVRHVVDPGSAA